MTQPRTLPPSIAQPTPPVPWRERTLARVVEHARAVLPVSAVPFVTTDGESAEQRSVSWFSTDELRAAMEPSLSLLARGRPVLLPRVEAWQAAPELKKAIGAGLSEEDAHRAWSTYRGASVIACPVRGEFGSELGALVVASLNERRPLGSEQLPTVEALADLAAMALERTDLLEAEGRRARDEHRLKRAAEAVSGSLEPAEVYVRVAEHAAA